MNLPLNLYLAYPLALLLLPAVGLLATWKARRTRVSGAVRVSTLPALPHTARVRWRHLPDWLRAAAVVLLILALARPQRRFARDVVTSEGIDIVLAMDVSGSMMAEDLQPNRLAAAQRAAAEFASRRPADRIGLVIFSGESFTQCPVTPDGAAVQAQITALRSGLLEDGTAIGLGLATAVDALRTLPGKSRVVVLLTDGVNNSGAIDPLTALSIAKTYGVRVYTVGVGTTGEALFPVATPAGMQKTLVPVEIDEALLQRIARETGGRYFRATDNRSLDGIYAEIDRLEKRPVESVKYTQRVELFYPLAGLAVLLLAAEAWARGRWLRGVVA